MEKGKERRGNTVERRRLREGRRSRETKNKGFEEVFQKRIHILQKIG
jgi:hypothetical protein